MNIRKLGAVANEIARFSEETEMRPYRSILASNQKGRRDPESYESFPAPSALGARSWAKGKWFVSSSFPRGRSRPAPG